MLVYRPRVGRYVANFHNIEMQRFHERADLAEDGRRYVRLRRESRRLALLEGAAAADARATNIVVSELDAARLGGSSLIVPNGADVPERVPPIPPDGGILFVGALDYPPNIRAVSWWVDEVARHLGPGVGPLTVVSRQRGRVPHVLLEHSAVRFVGEVRSVAPHLPNARVVVVPVRDGGGTRLKLIEALAWGRPVVTTTKGAEGFSVESGRHALVADRPAEFAAAVARLLYDNQLAERLAIAGRSFARQFAWPVMQRRFVDAVFCEGAHPVR